MFWGGESIITCSSGTELKQFGKFVLVETPLLTSEYASINIAAGRGKNQFTLTWSILSELNGICFSVRLDFPLRVSSRIPPIQPLPSTPLLLS